VLQIALAWSASLAHIAYLPQIARIGERIDRDARCGHARIIDEVRAQTRAKELRYLAL
jgi:hypothetical protein